MAYGVEIAALYRGRFEQVHAQRRDYWFRALLHTYLLECAQRCAATLPPNRVEMTKHVCAQWIETRNGFGVLISTYCAKPEERGTGLFVDPQLYAAEKDLTRNANSLAADFEFALAYLDENNKLHSDIDLLLSRERCASAVLTRFRENLRRYAVGEAPLLIGAVSGAAPIAWVIPGNETPPLWAWPFAQALTFADWQAVYDDVPDGFIPVPVDSGTIHQSVIKRPPGSGLLSMVRLRPLSQAALPGAGQYVPVRNGRAPRYSALYDLHPDKFQILQEDLETIQKTPAYKGRSGKQMVLLCSYAVDNATAGGGEYNFWFMARPQAADPARLRARLPDHPMLEFVGVAETCPPTPQAAGAVKARL